MEGMGNSLSVVDICWMVVPILPGLVNVYSLLFKMTIEIVDLPIDSLVILIFHSFLYVYQKLSTCSVLFIFYLEPKTSLARKSLSPPRLGWPLSGCPPRRGGESPVLASTWQMSKTALQNAWMMK